MNPLSGNSPQVFEAEALSSNSPIRSRHQRLLTEWFASNLDTSVLWRSTTMRSVSAEGYVKEGEYKKQRCREKVLVRDHRGALHDCFAKPILTYHVPLRRRDRHSELPSMSSTNGRLMSVQPGQIVSKSDS